MCADLKDDMLYFNEFLMLIHQDKNTTKKKVCNPSSLVFQFAVRLPLFLLVQLCFHTTY